MQNIAVSVLLFITLFALAGCGTIGQLGLVTRSSVEPESLLKSGKAYRELGQVWGKVCSYGTPADNFAKVVDDALAHVGGDALINVTTSTHRYPYLFLREKEMGSCTRVQGTAIKFIEDSPTSTWPESRMSNLF
ncbi:MAG: hypothetical protein E8D45_09450 [Nitrospira sp.]|nr:MAG: hypothetical protein E8D45_09450 [Nitrospira sp.]